MTAAHARTPLIAPSSPNVAGRRGRSRTCRQRAEPLDRGLGEYEMNASALLEIGDHLISDVVPRWPRAVRDTLRGRGAEADDSVQLEQASEGFVVRHRGEICVATGFVDRAVGDRQPFADTLCDSL